MKDNKYSKTLPNHDRLSYLGMLFMIEEYAAEVETDPAVLSIYWNMARVCRIAVANVEPWLAGVRESDKHSYFTAHIKDPLLVAKVMSSDPAYPRLALAESLRGLAGNISSDMGYTTLIGRMAYNFLSEYTYTRCQPAESFLIACVANLQARADELEASLTIHYGLAPMGAGRTKTLRAKGLWPRGLWQTDDWARHKKSCWSRDTLEAVPRLTFRQRLDFNRNYFYHAFFSSRQMRKDWPAIKTRDALDYYTELKDKVHVVVRSTFGTRFAEIMLPVLSLHSIQPAESDPAKISYFPTQRARESGRRLVMAAGKYFRKYFFDAPHVPFPCMAESWVQKASEAWAQAFVPPTVFFKEDDDPDGWEWVYSNEQGFHSCMSAGEHTDRGPEAIRSYALEGNGLRLAYLTVDNKPDSNVVARAIVRDVDGEKLGRARVYGDQRLSNALDDLGYPAKRGLLVGAVIAARECREGYYYVPYVDAGIATGGGSLYLCTNSPSPRVFEISNTASGWSYAIVTSGFYDDPVASLEGYKLKDTDDDYSNEDEDDGRVPCDHCGDMVHDTTTVGTEEWCEHCVDNHAVTALVTDRRWVDFDVVPTPHAEQLEFETASGSVRVVDVADNVELDMREGAPLTAVSGPVGFTYLVPLEGDLNNLFRVPEGNSLGVDRAMQQCVRMDPTTCTVVDSCRALYHGQPLVSGNVATSTGHMMYTYLYPHQWAWPDEFPLGWEAGLRLTEDAWWYTLNPSGDNDVQQWLSTPEGRQFLRRCINNPDHTLHTIPEAAPVRDELTRMLEAAELAASLEATAEAA